MKFMMTWAYAAERYQPTIDRFLETGAPAPEGAKLLGRWHAVAGRSGFLLVECEDAGVLYRYAAEWQDLIDLHVVPVVEDEEAGRILTSMSS